MCNWKRISKLHIIVLCITEFILNAESVISFVVSLSVVYLHASLTSRVSLRNKQLKYTMTVQNHAHKLDVQVNVSKLAILFKAHYFMIYMRLLYFSYPLSVKIHYARAFCYY